MSLRINVSGKYTVPNVLSMKYKFTSFDPQMQFRVTSNTGKQETKSVDVRRKLKDAWRFLTDRAATHKPCNDYFKTLTRHKTLKEVLDEGDITLHCLMPKPGYTLDDLPDANTAGRDIGIDPTFLLEPDNVKLGCALVHELAHVAGATTNPGDPNAGAAEAALKSCLCKDQYNPKALGMRIEIQTLGRSRVV